MFTIKITSDNAPKAIGPYSPALQIGDFMYFSGQLPVDSKTNELVEDNIKVQTRQSLGNLKALLNEVGLDTRHIVKTTVFMTDLSEFNDMNEVYALFFDEPYPARSCVQVAALPKGAKIETVTLEQALEMFKLPRIVGQTKDGEDIKANIGRFGPYIQIGKLFVSIKPEDPHTITLEKALELYDEKLNAEAAKNIADFGDGVKVLNGRYGPYITDGTKNAKIPKDVEPKDVTHEQAIELLAAAPTRSARRTTRTTAAKRTTTKRATATKRKTTTKRAATTKKAATPRKRTTKA